jgi:type VI secretion system protein ImpC
MSQGEEAKAQAQSEAAEQESVSILDQAITATKHTERSRAEEMLSALTDEAMKGTLTWSKNVTATINEGIKVIDAAVTKQLSTVMHDPKFQKLEGSWRGMHHLVFNSETSTTTS